VVSIDVATKDYRAVVLDKYFSKYNSPLTGLGSYFVAMCDKYALPKDCTLMPAIAYAETKLCTKSISDAQHNCWGWGGPGIYRTVYPSYEAAIEDMAKIWSMGTA